MTREDGESTPVEQLDVTPSFSIETQVVKNQLFEPAAREKETAIIGGQPNTSHTFSLGSAPGRQHPGHQRRPSESIDVGIRDDQVFEVEQRLKPFLYFDEMTMEMLDHFVRRRFIRKGNTRGDQRTNSEPAIHPETHTLLPQFGKSHDLPKERIENKGLRLDHTDRSTRDNRLHGHLEQVGIVHPIEKPTTG